MPNKTLLTLFHCAVSVALVVGGLRLGARLPSGDRQGFGVLVAAIVVLVPPVLFTRVAWAAGYEAGRAQLRQPPASQP